MIERRWKNGSHRDAQKCVDSVALAESGDFFFSMPIACKSVRLDQGTPCLPYDVVVGTHTAALSSAPKKYSVKKSFSELYISNNFFAEHILSDIR